MRSSLKLILAASTGVAVATIYLSQPLLNTLGQAFSETPGRIGLVSTVTQLGYALGLCFLIPLGDALPKKPLILTKFALLAGALLLTSFSTGYYALLGGSLLLGVFGSAAQDIVPLAAGLAEPHERGEVIGTVMSGLFLGILGSRTLSGSIATAFGWRAVFLVFALVVGIVILLVARFVPRVAATENLGYRQLIASLWTQFRAHSRLRSSLRTQGLLGVAFSAFWTNLSFHLGGPDFGLTNFQIGLFGLAGAAGVLAATFAGRLSDRRGPRTGILIGATLVAVSFAAMSVAIHSLMIVILGAVVFDLGVQMSLVSHQAIIYAIDPKARSSINAIFMTGMFLSFAMGSAVSVQVQNRWGWSGVLTIGLLASLAALSSAYRGANR